MQRDADGWHEHALAEATAGDRYRYRMPDGLRVPDPASRCNPDDVHGPSEVVDPRAYDMARRRVDAAARGKRP